jgi:hypothetical protein
VLKGILVDTLGAALASVAAGQQLRTRVERLLAVSTELGLAADRAEECCGAADVGHPDRGQRHLVSTRVPSWVLLTRPASVASQADRVRPDGIEIR